MEAMDGLSSVCTGSVCIIAVEVMPAIWQQCPEFNPVITAILLRHVSVKKRKIRFSTFGSIMTEVQYVVTYMLLRPDRMALFLAMFGLPCLSARWLWWCVVAGSVDRTRRRRRHTTVGRSSFSLTLPSRPASCYQVHSQSTLSSPNQTWDQINKFVVVSSSIYLHITVLWLASVSLFNRFSFSHTEQFKCA